GFSGLAGSRDLACPLQVACKWLVGKLCSIKWIWRESFGEGFFNPPWPSHGRWLQWVAYPGRAREGIAMCQCPPGETLTARSAPRRSVFVQGEAEAQAFKWILSQQYGYDVGDSAIYRWVREHWHGFLRQRWLEHLQGETFWIELDHDDSGLL